MYNRQIFPTRVLAQVAAIWVIADLGYYNLLPLLGFTVKYSSLPLGIAVYYLFWVAVSVTVFRPVFGEWKPILNRVHLSVFLPIFFAGVAVFAFFIMPNLPSAIWTESWDPPELLVASSWYFLPKSFEILLQQLLIAALVLAYAARGYGIRTIAIWCMVLFGGAHLFLSFGGLPLAYVVRFTISAMAFALVFPWLMLRVPNGFVYSYALHWFYYAATVVLAHTLSPYAA